MAAPLAKCCRGWLEPLCKHYTEDGLGPPSAKCTWVGWYPYAKLNKTGMGGPWKMNAGRGGSLFCKMEGCPYLDSDLSPGQGVGDPGF